MKERGILFSDPMVPPLLADTKTQTRRIMNPQPRLEADGLWSHPKLVGHFAEHVFGYCLFKIVGSPYGKPGDRLWVRETFRSWEENHCQQHTELDVDIECDEHCNQTYVAYRATPRIGFRPVPDRQRIVYLDENTPLDRNRNLHGPWKPGIHLPRVWSRIDLDIIEVRAERVQSISADDAIAEGVKIGELQDAVINGERGRVAFIDPKIAFAHLWGTINGYESWRANPWVWAITFKRIEESR